MIIHKLFNNDIMVLMKFCILYIYILYLGYTIAYEAMNDILNTNIVKIYLKKIFYYFIKKKSYTLKRL